MKQALKYFDGANPKIYAIATQTDDGHWHLACHWTDRVLEYDCELIEDRIGQHLRYGHGSILPLRNSKGELYSRWSEATDQDINDRPTPKEPTPAAEEEPLQSKGEEPLSVVTEEQQDEQPMPAEEPPVTDTPCYTDSAELERLKAENEALKARIAETAKEQQAARYDVITESRNEEIKESQNHKIKESRNQEINESRNYKGGKGREIMKAVGCVAAMSVALLIIWQTGLIIPVGIIGLVTSGILK